MKVLIVAKTRRGSGACVGGITWQGASVRLVPADAAVNHRAGLEYNVGEIWDIQATPDPHVIPPHVENVVVHSAHILRREENPELLIFQHMPPVQGGPTSLFDGLVQAAPFGALYIAEASGVPVRSTMFWLPDQPLHLDCEAKRIRYRYRTPDGGRTLTFVGFQEPINEIPAGTLVRVSLAHWWRPKDKPNEELRCYVQLSGWFAKQIERPRHACTQSTAAPINMVRHAATSGNQRIESETAPELSAAAQVLKRTFGFSSFLPVQQDVVERVLQGRDTLVVMPTGGGKSLCYQLPALLFDGLTVVVSPLIALMQDQVSQLRELSIAAAFLNSTLGHHEHVAVARQARRRDLRILYAAPETLLRPETLLLLEQSHLACLAVDEAHCISEWGHDFRPEYRQLDEVRRRFPGAVCLALTATATQRVRDDIRRLLRIEAAGEFVASFNRPNLFLAVEARRDGLGQTLRFLEQRRGQAGIIYCGTRKQVDQLAAELAARHWPALPYHAGLQDEVRRENQERFVHDDVSIIVATIAFGMGINKSNVRFVLHYNLPKDLESYYQEVGRAGRDGLPADCLFLYSRGDAVNARRWIEQGAESERPGREARLQAMVRYAETTGCRRVPLLSYFGEHPAGACGQCDHCVRPLESARQTDVTVAAQKYLSCVKQTGQVFGAGHIVDILRGSRSQRVLARGHDRLSTYRIGLEHSAEDWRELGQQFILQGLLDQDLEHGGLRLTPKAWRVLNGEKVLVDLRAEPVARLPRETKPAHHDSELFERLRMLRRQLALEAGVPPYVIFSDRALVEMATFYPQDQQQLLAIHGVGEAKLSNFGALFLGAIREHCQARGVQRAILPPAVAPLEPTQWLTVKRRFREVGEAFAAGGTLEDLAARFGVKLSTIVQNLVQYRSEGGQVDAGRVLASSRLDPADQERVLAAFDRLELERLAPVKEAVGVEVSYEDLHLLRLYALCRGQTKGR